MVSSLKTVVTHPGISDAGQCLTTALISDCGWPLRHTVSQKLIYNKQKLNFKYEIYTYGFEMYVLFIPGIIKYYSYYGERKIN